MKTHRKHFVLKLAFAALLLWSVSVAVENLRAQVVNNNPGVSAITPNTQQVETGPVHSQHEGGLGTDLSADVVEHTLRVLKEHAAWLRRHPPCQHLLRTRQNILGQHFDGSIPADGINEAVKKTLRKGLGGPKGRWALSFLADRVKGHESFLMRVALVDEQCLTQGEVPIAADRDLGLHEMRPPMLGSGPPQA